MQLSWVLAVTAVTASTVMSGQPGSGFGLPHLADSRGDRAQGPRPASGWSVPGAGPQPLLSSAAGQAARSAPFLALGREKQSLTQGLLPIKMRTEAEISTVRPLSHSETEATAWGLQRQVFTATRGCLRSAGTIQVQRGSAAATEFFLRSPLRRDHHVAAMEHVRSMG